MENINLDLASALRDRLAIISDQESRSHPEKHLARLKTVSERIEELRARLPKPVDPQLAHYLERRSYDKALKFLEEAPNKKGSPLS